MADVQNGPVNALEIAERALSGDPLQAKLDLRTPDGADMVLDGGFIIVRTDDDMVERLLHVLDVRSGIFCQPFPLAHVDAQGGDRNAVGSAIRHR